MADPTPPVFWSPRQSQAYAIAMTMSSGVTLLSTLVSFFLICRDPKRSRYPVSSRAIVPMLVGDFVYALTAFAGAMGHFAGVSVREEALLQVCVTWGSFIYFGHNLVFLSLLLLFVCAVFDAGEHRMAETIRRHFIIVACLPAALAALFQVAWALTYDQSAEELVEVCGADTCLEVIHIDSSNHPGLRVLYLLPLIVTMVMCPVLVTLAVRALRARLRREGQFTERERVECRKMITIQLIYLFTFYLCFWPNIFELFYTIQHEGCEDGLNDYWLYLCQAVFNPLHGFWNAIIFVWRPRFLRSMSQHQPLIGTSS